MDGEDGGRSLRSGDAVLEELVSRVGGEAGFEVPCWEDVMACSSSTVVRVVRREASCLELAATRGHLYHYNGSIFYCLVIRSPKKTT